MDAGSANPPLGTIESSAQSSFAFVALISLAAATGGLLFGFDTAVISGTQRFFQAEFHLSDAMTGWVVGSVLIGCMVGAGSAGTLTDRFGRKLVLLISAVLFFASAVACGLSRSSTELVIARLVAGLGVGIASMISPLYIAEVSPPASRGRLVALQQLAIVVGILLAFLTNTAFLHTSLVDPAKWRWMLALGAFPSAIFFLLLLPIPESPRWLVKQGQRDRAARILSRIAGPETETELAQIESAIAAEAGTVAELFEPGLRQALIIGVVLAVLQQFAGINAIMYYAPRIFEKSCSVASSAFAQTILVGLVNLVFTLVGMALVDRVGRKALLVAGAVGMTLTLALVGTAFAAHYSGALLLVPILAYVACFAATTGIVTWVIISEIFPTRLRGRAMSIAIVALWAACYLVSQTFPTLLDTIGAAATFFTYAAMNVITVCFAGFFVPETRGRTLETIEASWRAAVPVQE
jgi:SP family arabinose:H+ symporter-like MFS transporter